MAKSKTKYNVTAEEIRQLFTKHKIGNIITIQPLGAGEFNAVFKVETEHKTYVLKIAPPKNTFVLTYEKNMMRSEVFWYEKMHEYTSINAPNIYISDFSNEIISSDCFIMEMMEGQPLWMFKFTREEHDRIQAKKIEMLTQIHKIHNDKYGYLQTGLHDTWYDAIHNMVSNLITDCNNLGRETPDGCKLLQYIEKNQELLSKVPCSMVNFDLWDSNILYNNRNLTWIDPERSFWGDPIADFITIGKGQKTPLSEKLSEIEIYNRTAEVPISANSEECIRYAIAVGYLALVEEVEKYVRYEPDEENFIRNTVDARDMYDMTFKVLEEKIYE